ncbi:MAG: DUF2062 domain-containing protein [bacterium]|nr:DUF2062 domain-containing protein [bacterium]
MSKLKKFLEKFFLIDDTPKKVAGGAALGIFLGIFPGEGVLSTLFFATIFRLNKLAATAGVLATNMWMTIVILPLAAGVGSFIFRENYSNLISQFQAYRQFDTIKEALLFSVSVLYDFALPLLVGFFIVAGAIAIGSYFLLYFFLKRKNIKHLRDKIEIKQV